MAGTQSLLSYLTTVAPPRLPTQNTAPGSNTTSTNYSWRDITQISLWQDFNYNTVIQRYGNGLNVKQIMPDPMPTSPPRAIKDEPLFHARFIEYILPRVRRALRAGFEQLQPQVQAGQLTPTVFDGGSIATIVDNYRPDMAFVKEGDNVGVGPNRCPGDLKVSWKWKSAWRTTHEEALQREYKQAFSQVNFYMKQHQARYGFIITDTELVPVKRMPDNGHIAVANAVPWTRQGNGLLTVLLGLWYLGMLAASNDWRL
ncbi:MAG: hypothetical protein Q9217_006839 [Psora testacea]